MVNQKFRDLGVMTVLLRRMYSQRLPRIMMLKEKVDGGARLDHYDISYLEHILADTRSIQPTIERHPEYHQLAARVIGLYKAVIDQAVENERRT
ncbi:MAG: hypothetical protein OIF57_09825 [Marinobacterium sp.]|nr:hypothetical protein [Marinobacterium sp.]